MRLGVTAFGLTSAGVPTSAIPLIFLQAGCPSSRPTNSVKALKAILFQDQGFRNFPRPSLFGEDQDLHTVSDNLAKDS